jgi:hypothetical protein
MKHPDEEELIAYHDGKLTAEMVMRCSARPSLCT